MNILKFSIFTALGIVSLAASSLDSVVTPDDFIAYQQRCRVTMYHDGTSTSCAGFETFKTDDGKKIWHVAIPYLPLLINLVAAADGVVAVHKMRVESTCGPETSTRIFYHLVADAVCIAKLMFDGKTELSIIANEKFGTQYAEPKALGLILLAQQLSQRGPVNIKLDSVGEDVRVADRLKNMLRFKPIVGVSLTIICD